MCICLSVHSRSSCESTLPSPSPCVQLNLDLTVQVTCWLCSAPVSKWVVFIWLKCLPVVLSLAGVSVNGVFKKLFFSLKCTKTQESGRISFKKTSSLSLTHRCCRSGVCDCPWPSLRPWTTWPCLLHVESLTSPSNRTNVWLNQQLETHPDFFLELHSRKELKYQGVTYHLDVFVKQLTKWPMQKGL